MDLEGLREVIADCDMRIIELMSKRIDAAVEIGRIKVAEGLPIVDRAVEERVISRYVAESDRTGLSKEVLEKVARALIQEAVEQESSLLPTKGAHDL